MYKYFVSYAHRSGFGNIEMMAKLKITDIEHVRMMEEAIKKDKRVMMQVAIINYILLKNDDDETGEIEKTE